MTTPRVLVIMGSGETAPTMAKVHRSLFGRLGRGPVPAVVLDTPYGFQENADELSERTLEFFAGSVGHPVEVASYRSREVDPVTAATAVARIRGADFVMAGPGSPSYALRQWAGGPIPEALAGKLARGGIVVMASAAALTAGVVTIPVYEVYKVGEPPRWLEGLDLLGRATGLRAAVVPHYDNNEGGTHDTRFCYMGERRLRSLEAELPAGAFVLGVDSHTALVLDLDAGTASVAGLGGVTVRVDGRDTRFAPGSEFAIGALAEVAAGLAAGEASEAVHGRALGTGSRGPAGPPAPGTGGPAAETDPVARLDASFADAFARDDVPAAVAALLELHAALEGRLRSGEDSPELDRATTTFRALVAQLGDRAGRARGGDPTSVVAPFVETILELRAAARAAGDWAASDRLRDRLLAAGVEVRDAKDGASWIVRGPGDAGSG